VQRPGGAGGRGDAPDRHAARVAASEGGLVARVAPRAARGARRRRRAARPRTIFTPLYCAAMSALYARNSPAKV